MQTGSGRGGGLKVLRLPVALHPERSGVDCADGSGRVPAVEVGERGAPLLATPPARPSRKSRGG